MIRHVAPAHVLVGGACVGLAGANAARVSAVVAAVLAAAAAAGAAGSNGFVRLALAGVAVAAGAWWWGSARLDVIDRSVLVERAGSRADARLVVTGPVRRTPFALRVPARTLRVDGQNLSEPVLLELPPGRAPPQGAILELRVLVKLPRGPRDGFDEREWLRRHGVHVVLRGDDWTAVGRRGGIAGLGDRIRARLARTLAPGLAGERRAVLLGIVLGEDEGLSDELREKFRASGLYHLLAVSGQNVALVAGGVLLLAWLVGVPRWMGHVGALGGIGAYVLAVGAQPSVVRAGVAGALVSFAWLAARQRDRWHFLLLGALVLLAWSPYNLLEPGFQLSFAAVAAIFVFVPRIQRELAGYPLPRFVADVLAVSTACGAATAPILLLHFGSVSVVGVFANVLAAPAVVPLLGLAFAAVAADPVAPAAAETIGWLNGWCAAYLTLCARLVGGLPFAQTSSPLAALLVVGACLLPLGVLRLSARRRGGILVATGCAVGLVAGWKATAPPSPAPSPPTGLRITFLDVGQGDATLLQVPGGAILLDQGPPEADAAGQLRRLGVTSLAAMVLTHPSRDNIGGARDVLSRIRVQRVLEPGLPFENPYGTPVVREAARRGIPVHRPRRGDVLRLGRLSLHVLWPPDTTRRSDDPNDHAVVILASYGRFEALLPADAESNVTLPLRVPPVEVLKMGHHGSSDEGLADLLQELRPRLAVISVGVANDYGHPAPSTLAALSRVPQLEVVRTDRDGRIVVETDGATFEIREER